MNLRLRIGQLRSRIEIWLLCSFAGRFLRQFPYRRHWAFDVLRFLSDRQPRVIFDIGANVVKRLNTFTDSFLMRPATPSSLLRQLSGL